jgi:hypothetical protein
MPKKKPALLQAATYGMSGSFLLWKRYALSPAELCSKAQTELSNVGLLNALLLTIAIAPCLGSPPDFSPVN